MKKKLPVIILLIILAVCIFIVTKAARDKKVKELEYKELAQKVSQSTSPEMTSGDSDAAFEFIQTNPENGLAVIYSFNIYPENDGVRSGKITIDGNGVLCEISCAVTKQGDADTFIFGKYLTDDTAGTSLFAGDILVKLHAKDGRIIPEWCELSPIFKGEDVMPNF